MNEEDLATRVRQYNALQIGLGVLAAIAAAVMWYVTFWIVRGFCSYVLSGLEVDAAWSISGYVAGVVLMLLVVEGLIYGRGQFDWGTVADRHFSFTEPGESVFTVNYGARQTGRVLAGAHLFTWFLFSAPHLTMHAAKTFRSRIQAPQEIYPRAAKLLEYLTAQRKWVPISQIPKTAAAAVFLLSRLRLVWTNTVDGELQVRVPSGSG